MKQSFYFENLADTFDDDIEKILKELVKHIGFDGWPSVTSGRENHKALNQTAKALNMDINHIKAIFHFATELDFISAVNRYVDKVMIKNYKVKANTSITDKVYYAVKARLDFEMKYKKCFEKSMFYLSNPTNLPFVIKLTTRTANNIWETIGISKSEADINSRSVSLGLVLVATWTYWLGGKFDKEDEKELVLKFLKNRLYDVVSFGKFKAKFDPRPKKSRSDQYSKSEFKVKYLYDKPTFNKPLIGAVNSAISTFAKFAKNRPS